MRIFIINRSKQILTYAIDQQCFHTLNPGESFCETIASDIIKLSIYHQYESFVIKKKWQDPEYHLVLNSEYVFTHVEDGCEFVVSRESIRFDLIAFYDRFFVHCKNAWLASENHIVSNSEKMILEHHDDLKKEKKRDFIQDFIILPLLYAFLPDIFILLLIGFFYSWNAALHLALVIYFISFIIIIAAKGVATLIQRMFRKKDDFLEFFDHAFILHYYAQSDRIPFFGNFENGGYIREE